MQPEGTLIVFTNDNFFFLSFVTVNHFDVNYKLTLF